MAAIQTLAQASRFRKSSVNTPSQIESYCQGKPAPLRPRRGVIVLYGYGTSVRVERGHLIVEDGVGSDRYKGKFPRVGHGIERLVMIGADGVVSLAAIRWLADQKASFVMLERDGSVLATTAPARPSDIRLRRAQALAYQTGAAFRISRELIDRKLAGQQRVALELRDRETSENIKRVRSELAEVDSIDAIRLVESRAAKVYWKAWRSAALTFPDKELLHVPEHWRSFGSRASALTGSSRLAVNPVNAVLNYLYALLEAECRLAIAALGLDPEMGVLHMDTINRDSFACDLMEPIRPDVDAYVLNWIGRQPLKRSWFFEERNGNCRLMSELTIQLAETAQTWARLVAPLAEWAVKQIAATTRVRVSAPATRLTQNHKRALSGGEFAPKSQRPATPKNVCSICENEIRDGNTQCSHCAVEVATQRIVWVAAEGRGVSHTDKAESKRSKTRKANHAAQQAWSASDKPTWLTEKFYVKKMQPLLGSLSSSVIARQLRVSRGYATEIRNGRVPHPRHWKFLAEYLAVSI
jgi:CRISPR-associated endonuclease Cas1